MVSITESDVRDAGDLAAEDYPDGELGFEISFAEDVVTREVEPHATDEEMDAVERTAALFAAAVATDGTSVTDVSLGGQSLSFDSEQSKSLFELASIADPTGRLDRIVNPDQDDPFVFSA